MYIQVTGHSSESGVIHGYLMLISFDHRFGFWLDARKHISCRPSGFPANGAGPVGAAT
jgi:hypothetical protein